MSIFDKLICFGLLVVACFDIFLSSQNVAPPHTSWKKEAIDSLIFLCCYLSYVEKKDRK